MYQASFSIKTAQDFFDQIVIPEYEDFTKNNSSPRHALLCIITAYHMYEWVYGKKFSSGAKASMNADTFNHFEIARKMTNSTKHFRNRIKTRIQVGFSSAFSSAFARSMMIAKDDGGEVSVDDLLCSLVGFWKVQQAQGAF